MYCVTLNTGEVKISTPDEMDPSLMQMASSLAKGGDIPNMKGCHVTIERDKKACTFAIHLGDMLLYIGIASFTDAQDPWRLISDTYQKLFGKRPAMEKPDTIPYCAIVSTTQASLIPSDIRTVLVDLCIGISHDACGQNR